MNAKVEAAILCASAQDGTRPVVARRTVRVMCMSAFDQAPNWSFYADPEQRRYPRLLTLETATIESAYAPIDCAILDVSPAGACLLVPDGSTIPVRFDLQVHGGALRVRCQQVWRNGPRIGVCFVPHRPVRPAGS